MKRKTITLLVAGTVLAVSFLALEAVNARRTGSGTTRVSLNGRSFAVGNNLPDGAVILRRELAKLGVDVPENDPSLEAAKHLRLAVPENPFMSGKSYPEKTPGLPEGFRVDKTLKMSGEDGTILLAMGTTARGGSAASHLEADKWTRAEMAGGAKDIPKVFRKNRGREADIVCLDEKQGSFLLLRRVEQ